MEGLFRFFNQAKMSYKSLFAMLTIQNYLLVKTLMPLFQMIFFIMTAKFAFKVTDLTPWIVGNSLVLVSFNAFFGVATSFTNDRGMGTLKVIIASPVNKFVIFIGRTVMHIMDGFISVVLGLIVGITMFGLDLSNTNLFYFFLITITGVFSVMSLGILIGIFALLTREIHMLLNICYSLLLLFSGANIPLESLPRFLQYISQILPLTRSVKGAQLLVINNEIQPLLLLEELVVGLFYLLIAIFLYNGLEKLARNGSQIDVY